MLEWLDRHLWFGVSIIGGIIVSILTAENHSVWIATARVACGLFCAVVFTDPLLDILMRDPEIYRNAMAGLLAVSGYAGVRMINSANWSKLSDLIKAVRSK